MTTRSSSEGLLPVAVNFRPDSRRVEVGARSPGSILRDIAFLVLLAVLLTGIFLQLASVIHQRDEASILMDAVRSQYAHSERFVRQILLGTDESRRQARQTLLTMREVQAAPLAADILAGASTEQQNRRALALFDPALPAMMQKQRESLHKIQSIGERLLAGSVMLDAGGARDIDSLVELTADLQLQTDALVGRLDQWRSILGPKLKRWLFLLGALTLLLALVIVNQRARKYRDQARLMEEIDERMHAEQTFRELIGQAPDAIIIVDTGGKIRLANKQAEALFGRQQEDMVGDSLDTLLPTRIIEKHHHMVRNYFASPRSRPMGAGPQLFARGPGDKDIPIEISLSPVRSDDETLAMASIRDVSRQYEARQQLDSYARELKRSNEELEQFAYVASHDLQEPLRKVQAFGDLLREECGEQLNQTGLDYLERMRSAAQRMATLITDLLTLSRVTSEARPFTSVDLTQLLRELLVDLEVSMEKAGATLTVEGELPVVEGDGTQLHQLFLNLLSNSLKFRHPERDQRLTVAGSREGDCCRITVTDNGIGFEEQYAERIFGVFQRLHGRTKYEGTGVGLAICRKVVERHGGTIRAEGRAGEGARFFIELPLKQSIEGGAGQ